MLQITGQYGESQVLRWERMGMGQRGWDWLKGKKLTGDGEGMTSVIPA